MKTGQSLITLSFCFLHFGNSWLLNKDHNVEASGLDTDTNLVSTNNEWTRIRNFQQNILRYEQKLNSMTSTFNQLEEKINSLISSHMDRFEETLRSTVEQLVDEKIKLNIQSKINYNTQEIKCSNNRLPENCYELNECNNNIYSIMNPKFSDKPFPAVCEFKTLDGGWTIIQRRQDGFENFFRNWTEYVQGFGNLNGEFFIGLEKLHVLTAQGKPQELYIILEDFDGDRRNAHYKTFQIESESSEYKLKIGDYSGNAGDSLKIHNEYKFSTWDRDNDVSNTNCAERWKGGWWYHSCYNSNLNGRYLRGRENNKSVSRNGQGISWGEFRGVDYSLKFVQMMIRSKEN